MQNSEYWKIRFGQLEAAQNQKGADAYLEIEKIYKQAQKEIEGKINTWYQRFADNNGVSMAEARKMLSGTDLKEFKWDVKEYIKYGQDNALMGGWTKELENASAKFHISRLEVLKMHTQHSLEVMFEKQLGITTGTMTDILQSGYYHTAYELQKGFGIGWDIAGLDQSHIEKLLSKPWAVDGKNFSERIWSNKEKLISEIHNELTRNVMLGQNPQKAIDAIAKKMNTSKHNAGRLVMTEEAYFSSAAQKDCFNDLDVEEYEIVATLDSHTSDICQSLDGQVFPMKDFEPGITAPPFHVYCRSTTVPHFDENFGQVGERAARDEDGNTYYIPDDMNYQEWKETFVDGGDKSGFDAYDQNGVTHYTKHKDPEPPEPEKPKKEYLTKKKLQANIANADVQIEDLDKQFSDVMKADGGLSWEEFKNDYQHDYSQITDVPDELSKLQAIGDQIDALEAQKAEWQAKLDEKLLAEEKKALTKQQKALQEQLDNFQIKTYSGIWKDDVTTADYAAKMGGIEGKKKYYEGKFITETDPVLMQKYQDLYKQLSEFETEGKSYHDIQSELKKVQKDLSNLGKPKPEGKPQFSPDAYEQRKTDAWAQRFTSKYEADKYYRPLLDADWNTLTEEEKFAVWQYTHNSHPINRPLSGYNGRWGRSNYTGIDKVRWDNENGNYDAILSTKTFQKKYANAVSPSYGGQIRNYQDVVAELTTGIEKSGMQKDVFLVRGSDLNGLAGLLEGDVISFKEAEQLLNAGDIGTLKSIIEKQSFQSHSFMSTGIADGTGFGGNVAYKIYAPAGTKAIYAEPASYYGNTISGEHIYKSGATYSGVGGEAEIIIQRGTTFRVTSIEKTGSSSYVVNMEVVDQPDYFKTGYEHTFDGGLTSEK